VAALLPPSFTPRFQQRASWRETSCISLLCMSLENRALNSCSPIPFRAAEALWFAGALSPLGVYTVSRGAKPQQPA
jgi:hypothetical protein